MYWTGVSGVGNTRVMGALLSEGSREALLYTGHADKVRERVKRGEGGGKGKKRESGGGGGKWANSEDIFFTTVSFSDVVCRHVHRGVSPT